MAELKTGDRVSLVGGKSVTIKKELGRGGQGIVYLVNFDGKDMALKWYLNAPDNYFYTNLNNNILNGAPSDAFLWPKALTERQNGSYGYVMDLRPKNYFEFGNFLMAKAKFKSFNAMLAAAMKICNGFMMLHRFGYSYQDLNDGNFFIDPQTGDVLICDNDNVMPQGEKSGIMGKARYMAPEVVAGGIPDKYSDRYSLSVILFMLFYANHPLEGAKVVACPCMTEAYEKKFYGSEAVFIYNPNDKSNLPVRGIHQNVIRRWSALPAVLRDTFTREFSEEMLRNPQKRMIEQNWEKLIATLRDSLVICPHCHEETFIEEGKNTCMDCDKPIDTSLQLKLGARNLYLTDGTKLYIDHDNTADVQVLSDPNAGLLLLKNLSPDATWTAETPSGKLKAVAPGDVMPVKAGIVDNVADYAYSSWAEYSGEVYSQARICHVEAVLRRIPFEQLKELVCTPLPESLHVMDIEDEVTRHRLSDEQVKELIKIYSHCSNATEFQRLERSLQAEFIHIFRKKGASWRQLERHTGLSRGFLTRL